MSNSQSWFSGNQKREKTKPKEYFVYGVGFLVGALILLVIWQLIQVPPQYKTFLFIPYAVNPDYVMVVTIRFFLAIMTVVFGIFGLLLLILGFATHVSAQPENPRMEPPKPSLPTTTIFCPYCGAENKSENSFCIKCGRKIQPLPN
jgi:ABC-type phosphate transport system permease subunit